MISLAITFAAQPIARSCYMHTREPGLCDADNINPLDNLPPAPLARPAAELEHASRSAAEMALHG